MGFGWKPYVPAGQRRQSSALAVERMRKSGVHVQPVHIEGRLIARTFWGQAWCRHLESYSDFENRLPRGRTYVRNGSVCHLEIMRGRVNAKVQGSRMYSVEVNIRELPRPAWKSIKQQCGGRISSLLDLLQGKLSSGVMEVVTDRQKGLFPSPKEITMECSCPDWATMCKHVAAVLYGVAARLDDKPELLFLLRGVDHEELIQGHAEEAVRAVVHGGKGRRIAEKDLTAIFGVEIDAGPERVKKAGLVKPLPRHQGSFPSSPLGSDIRDLRERLHMTRGEFALLLGVSQAAVSVWERSSDTVRLQRRTRAALERAWAAHGPIRRKTR